MCKFNPRNDARWIDPCLKPLLNFLRKRDYDTISSCCGHGRYPMTIVCKFMQEGKPVYIEILSNTTIPRKVKFYKKDKKGVYFIPEVLDGKS